MHGSGVRTDAVVNLRSMQTENVVLEVGRRGVGRFL
jgi:hypothetical protein